MTKMPRKPIASDLRNGVLQPSKTIPDPKTISIEYIQKCAKSLERGDADLFVSLKRGFYLYDKTVNHWYYHNAGVWSDVNAEILISYQDVLSIAYKRLFAVDSEIAAKALKRVSTLSKSKAGIETARGLLISESKDFDANDEEINLPNGVYNFKSRTFRAHKPTDKFKIQLPYDYKPDEDCPQFKAFLNRIFENDKALIEWLQNRIGICLTGQIPHEEFIFGYGTGGNGKGMLTGILQMLLGEYCRIISADLILTNKQSNEDERTKVRLYKARLVIANEVGKHRRIDEATLKSLTGGKSDKIVARRLYGEQFEFVPTHKLWCFGNDKPNFSGTDEAMKRRLKTLPFSVTIPKDKRTDKEELFNVFRVEISGILNWAIEGYYMQPKEPGSVREATEEYFAENDSLGRFLEEQTSKEPNSRERLMVIFEAYKKWCIDSGNRQIHRTNSELKKAILERAGYEKGIYSGGAVAIIGLIMNSNQTEAI